MGWLYLVVSINGAAYTVNARRPAKRNRYTVGWSFFASWVTIELAPFHIIWQVIASALFVRKGVLRTNPGRIGFAISMASLVGLVLTVRQAYGSRDEVREALRELRDEPLPVKTHDVRWERHITFARAGGRELRMDVVSPSDPPEKGVRRPVMVQVHGGGWVLGFKQHQGQLLMVEMARAGWVCANVDYRLSPAATFPDHLVDVKRAIAWIREHAERFGADPDFVAVTGGSAGGHLTALTALTQNDPTYQPGFADADTSVQAAVPFYGVYDFTDRLGTWMPGTAKLFIGPWVMKTDLEDDPEGWAAASPIDRVNPEAPPMLVVHGNMDLLAPVEDARLFVERLAEVSNEPVYYLELTGAQHAFEVFPSIRANAVIEGVARFLNASYSDRAGVGKAQSDGS
jgi:acetyl esterase/lipase